jgi:EAL domain-containing protein (putative c-di-GMP-specific phosphodiesterase class I)
VKRSAAARCRRAGVGPAETSFIAGLTHKPDSQAIVTAIIQLAHSLGMAAVSEGVETITRRDQLVPLNCDGCQGFDFARPMPAANLDRLLQQQADLANPRLPAHALADDHAA